MELKEIIIHTFKENYIEWLDETGKRHRDQDNPAGSITDIHKEYKQ